MDELPEITRTKFFTDLDIQVDKARVANLNLGLMLIDLSNLGRINQCHGYHQGDHLLTAAYLSLLSVSKLPDTVFRIASHHFTFILPDLDSPAFIALAVNKVRHLLLEELDINDDMIEVDINIGIAINSEASCNAQAMLARAENSLAQVKRGGSIQIDELTRTGPEVIGDSCMEQVFADTLNDNAFELHYQPKVNLVTGAADLAEALVRWKSPHGDNLPPELAVDLAESSGQDYALTKWVVHRALRQMSEWRESLDIGIAVNVQASLVSSPDLLTLIQDAIAIWGVAADKVTVEITESGIIRDKESSFDNLVRLKALGIKLSIDDFGTGYSSLSYFKHIPATELKIDQSFVRSMTTDEGDLELVKIIITIAHQFGLTVVAEGVEDRASLDLLRQLGCDYVQGYFFSKPLPPRAFENWVRQWPGL